MLRAGDEEVLQIVHHQHNEPANKKLNVNYITRDEDENGYHKCLHNKKNKNVSELQILLQLVHYACPEKQASELAIHML
jgi:hypothetical protein